MTNYHQKSNSFRPTTSPEQAIDQMLDEHFTEIISTKTKGFN